MLKIQELFSNGKYWQKKAQSKNSKKAEQTLYCLKVAKIGKMWDKQIPAKSGKKFTLAFRGKYWHKKSDKIRVGKYWHKKSDKIRVRKPYGKKWQNAAQANYGSEWYKL